MSSHLDKNIKTTTLVIRASFAVWPVFFLLHFLQTKPVKQLQTTRQKSSLKRKETSGFKVWLRPNHDDH